MTLFSGPITGRKFLAIFASFFVVIIAVNLFMATQAIRTFPGLEVRNSYVASQTFDADRAAQVALGWTVTAEVTGGELVLAFTDSAGAAVQPVIESAIFGRATSVRDDQTPAFVFDGSVFRAPVLSPGGNWNLRLVARAADGTAFRQRIVIDPQP